MQNFDSRVATLRFADILTSNDVIDVGRGDFAINVYHCRPPTGGGKQTADFGMNMDTFLKKKRCIVKVPHYLSPDCLIMAMKIGLLHKQGTHKHYFVRRAKNLFCLQKYAEDVREFCHLPEGPLNVTHIDKLVNHLDFQDATFSVFERKESILPKTKSALVT